MNKLQISIFTIASALTACTAMYIIEQYTSCSYLIKTIIKIIIFTGLPILSAEITKYGTIKQTLGIQHIKIRKLKTGFIIGAAVFLIITAAYFLLGNMIDFDSIKNELETKLKITSSTFIFVGLYITFINSFIEELFFRGYIFLNLYNSGFRKTGFTVSSLLFGLYHMAIFQTWFPAPLLVLSVTALVITGIFFNYMNIKNRNFLNSWIVHIIADTAVIIIGLRMFYL